MIPVSSGLTPKGWSDRGGWLGFWDGPGTARLAFGDGVWDGVSLLDTSNGRLGDPTYLGCSEELGGGFSCGFVGAGFARGVGDVGMACELAEAVGCGDSGLGSDHVCADFGYFFGGFE